MIVKTNEYWKIAIPEILSEAGLVASDEQVKQITDLVSEAASVEEEYSQPVCYDVNKDEVKKEYIGCIKCSGRGYFVEQVGTCHSTTDTCMDCKGYGSIAAH